MKRRLKALEARAAQDGIPMTEAPIAALEKAKADKEAHGEFESECLGYCGAQRSYGANGEDQSVTFAAGSKLTGVPHAAAERPQPIAYRSEPG